MNASMKHDGSNWPHRTKIGVWNSRKEPHVVAVEPWGDEYTLLPEETLEVVAFGKTEVPWFVIVEWEGATQVFCENSAEFKVWLQVTADCPKQEVQSDSSIAGVRGFLKRLVNVADLPSVPLPDDPLPTPKQREMLCDMIFTAFVELRALSGDGHSEQSENLADAFHNISKEMYGWGGFKWDNFRWQLDRYQRRWRGNPIGSGIDYVAMLDGIQHSVQTTGL